MNYLRKKKKTVGFEIDIGFESRNLILDLLKKKKEVHYKIQGIAKVSIFDVAYKKEGIISIPEIQFLDYELKNFSFNSLSFLLRLKVKNTNEFDIPIKNLNYSLLINESNFLEGGLMNLDKINKQSEQTIEIPMDIYVEKLIRVLKQLSKKEMIYLKANIFLRFGFYENNFVFEKAIPAEKILSPEFLFLLNNL